MCATAWSLAIAMSTLGACSASGRLWDAEATADADAEAIADADGEATADALGPVEPWVAFASNRAGSFDIYLIHPDGSDLHPIVQGPGDDLYPSWSPDGANLAFSSNRSGISQLHTVDVETGTETVVPIDIAEGIQPAWSPDGTRLAFGGAGGLFLVAAAGGATTPLATGGFRDNAATWAPDGSAIYFSSDRGGEFDIWSVHPDGTGLVQVTTGSNLVGGPAISPDGRTLAYASGAGSSMDVTLWSLATGTPLILSEMGDSEPAFSPSGARVALTSLRFSVTNPEIAIVDASGAADVVRLTNDPGVDGQATFQPIHR